MSKYAIATFIVCSVEGFVCYLIGYMVGITHDKRTITHECVKDTHDKTSPNCSEKPNNCEECKHWNDTEDDCADRHGCRTTTEDCSTVKPQNYCDDCLYCDTCDSKEFFYACTSKATISKMEPLDKDTNVRSKEPLEMRDATAEERQGVRDYIDSISEVYVKDEPQTDCAWGKGEDHE